MLENKNTPAQAIGSVIRAELARRNLPIATLVDVLDISQGSLYARVRGIYPFDFVQLHKIAQFFEMTVKDLVSEAQVAA